MYPGPNNRGGSQNPFTGGMQMTPTSPNTGYGYPGVASPVYGNQGYAGNSPAIPQYGAPPNGQYGSPQQGSPYTGYGGGYQQPKPQGNMAGLDPGLLNSQAILNRLEGIYIKQKMSLTEVITGYNTANKYMVFELSDRGESLKKPIFECKETSDCCERNCVAPECRGISLDIRKVPQNVDYDGEVILRLVRECQCTCLCCNRPEMKVYYVEGGQNLYLGRIYDPYDCCTSDYEVFDAANNKRFHVEADCCQKGFLCNCPCESCEVVEFKLWSGDKQVQQQSIHKRGTGNCCKNAISTADHFSVPFPQGSTWQDKALLLSLSLMIDFLQFEEPQEDHNRKGRSNGYSSLY